MHFSHPSPMQYQNLGAPVYPQIATPSGRRAAVLMWLLGGLLLLMAGTSCIHSILLTPDQFHQLFQEQMKVAAENKIPSGGMPVSESMLHTFSSIFDGVLAGIGLAVVLLAFGVRRGRRGQTLAATVIAACGAVAMAVFILIFFVMGMMSPMVLEAAILLLVISSPLFLLVFWLFSALKRPALGGPVPQPQLWPAMPPTQAPANGLMQGPAWSPYGPPMTAYGAPPAFQTMPTRPMMAPPPPVVSVLGYGYPGIAPPPPPPQNSAPILPPIPTPGPSQVIPPAPPADSVTPSP